MKPEIIDNTTIQLISDTQSALLKASSPEEALSILTEKISSITGGSIIFTSMLDESGKSVRVVAYSGLNNYLDIVIKTLGMDPTKTSFLVSDMTEEEINKFKNGGLELIEGGIYDLLTRKVPKPLCSALERMLGIKASYVKGIQLGGRYIGGFTILVRQNIAPFRDYIEQIVNQAAIIILRMRAEKNLTKEKDLARKYLDLAGSLIVALNSEGKVSLVNEACSKILGLPQSEIIGSDWFERFIPAGVRESVKRCFHDLLAGEITFTEYFENPILSSGGSERIILWHNTVYKDEHGNITGILGSGEDITERKRYEEKLRESEEKYRDLFENSVVPIWVEDFSGAKKRFNELSSRGITDLRSYLKANPAEVKYLASLVRITELNNTSVSFMGANSKDEVIRHLPEYFVDKSWDPFREELIALAAGQTNIDIELPIRDLKGRERQFQVKLFVAPGSEVTLSRVIVSFADITERIKAEEERQRMESRLNQAQKMESLGVLAGGIAHDFNNLLSVIFGNIELAHETITDQEALKFLDSSSLTINRARTLTRQLLTFAKGGSPARKIQSFSPFLKDAVAFALSGSNAECSYRIQEGLWNSSYDKHQLEQVIDNIVINALQAKPTELQITVTAENATLQDHDCGVLPGGRYVRISIADNGPGIPSELLARIFEPFYTTKSNGTGLGLSISYSIISRHEGCIYAESNKGHGSIFHIYLPASDKAGAAPEKTIRLPHKGSGTILVMDDEEEVRYFFARFLEKMGYTAITEANSIDTVAALIRAKKNGQEIKAAILDLTIKGETGGIDALKELRSIEPGLKAFVVSGYAEDQVMSDPAKYGFTDSIGKPFELSELEDMLNRHLSPHAEG